MGAGPDQNKAEDALLVLPGAACIKVFTQSKRGNAHGISEGFPVGKAVRTYM